jgi:hypothetical protein
MDVADADCYDVKRALGKLYFIKAEAEATRPGWPGMTSPPLGCTIFTTHALGPWARPEACHARSTDGWMESPGYG